MRDTVLSLICFLSSPSFGVSGGLCFLTEAFPRCLHLYFGVITNILLNRRIKAEFVMYERSIDFHFGIKLVNKSLYPACPKMRYIIVNMYLKL